MADNAWTSITLGELVARGAAMIQTGPFGSQLHSYDYEPVGIPVVPTEAIGWRRLNTDSLPRITAEKAAELSRHRLKQGDILFARRGIQATGLSALVEPQHKDWICGTGAILLRLQSDDIDPVFLSFYLIDEATRQWLRTNAVGAVMPNLNEEVLKRLPLQIPPKKEQERIADILAALDDKIELNRRMNETLEAMARRLFRSWFVDFDPVHAKAAVRREHPKWSNAEVSRKALPKMAPEIAELFPDSFEESTLGRIPATWRVKSFTDDIMVFGGGTPKTSNADYWNGDIPWFSVVDSPRLGEVFVIDTEKKVTAAGIENSSTKILPIGTTIISARGTVGNLALVGVPMAMNQSCYGLYDREHPDGYFLYFVTANVIDELRQRTHGSVFDTITRDTLGGIHVVAPFTQLVTAFEKAVGDVVRRLRESLHESTALAKTRDALLPKLLSGELIVSELQEVQ